MEKDTRPPIVATGHPNLSSRGFGEANPDDKRILERIARLQTEADQRMREKIEAERYAFLDEIDEIAAGDAGELRIAQESYGDSWKKRGGVGAFMMLARKWDRIERAVSAPGVEYDIFECIEEDGRPVGIIDDIRDLRGYLMLVEAEVIARGKRRGACGVGEGARSPL